MLLVVTAQKAWPGKYVIDPNCGGPQVTLHYLNLHSLRGLCGALGPTLRLPAGFTEGGSLEMKGLPSCSLQGSEDQPLAKDPTIQLE